MAIYRTYNCPDCNGVFDFLHHPNDEPPPSYCPLCGSYVGPEKKRKKKRLNQVARIMSPNRRGIVRSGETSTRAKLMNRSGEQVYRQMESSSEQRMQQAANMLGVDTKTLTHMKTTNMKDNVRVGETSYIPPSTTPASQIRGHEIKASFGDGTTINSHFGQTSIPTSGQPNTELQKTMSTTFANHQNLVQATVAAGIKK